MDDALFGKRDKRGDWKPLKPIEYPPVFVWPPRPVGFLKWFFGNPGYILPWNLVYAAAGLVLYFFLTPPMETMRSFAVGWIAYLLARNELVVLLFFGAFHLWLYVWKRQGQRFKFNGKWPSTGHSSFLFGDQVIDNMIWALASAVPVWTCYEAVTLWAYANGYLPSVSFAAHPVYFVALMFLVPVFREIHFYLIHRMIHWPPLYRTVHKLHHNNVNPGPWSGLAMHPVEHLLYFSCVFVHWIIPSHPVHAVFNLVHTALAPAPGHAGFDKVMLREGAAIDTESFNHYLHHKFFECNYADGAIPLDRWFGTFHDGTAAAQEAMDRRFLARNRASAAKSG